MSGWFVYKNRIAPFHDPYWTAGLVASVIVNRLNAFAGDRTRKQPSDFMPIPPAEYGGRSPDHRGESPMSSTNTALKNRAVLDAMVANQSKG